MKSKIPMLILGIDPGKTTGFSLYSQLTGEFNHWESEFGEEVYRDLESLQYEDWALVIENFDITQDSVKKANATLWSAEIIGVARYLFGDRLTISYRAEAKRLATDKLLRSLGLWNTSNHINDATRHVLLYLAKNHQELFDALLKENGL